MNVSHGQAGAIGGLTAALDQPEFATSIGLVKFGSLKTRQRRARPGITANLKDAFGKFLQRS
jgi:nucleoid DNA-binding protein